MRRRSSGRKPSSAPATSSTPEQPAQPLGTPARPKRGPRQPARLQGYLTTQELARKFGMSTRTLARKIAAGDAPPYVVLSERKLFRNEAVEEWLLRQERGGGRRR